MCVKSKHFPNRTEANLDVGIGAAYGTAKSGIGIAGVGTYRPDLIMKVYFHAPNFRAVN